MTSIAAVRLLCFYPRTNKYLLILRWSVSRNVAQFWVPRSSCFASHMLLCLVHKFPTRKLPPNSELVNRRKMIDEFWRAVTCPTWNGHTKIHTLSTWTVWQVRSDTIVQSSIELCQQCMKDSFYPVNLTLELRILQFHARPNFPYQMVNFRHHCW